MANSGVALLQDVKDDFVSSTEMGRDMEKSLSDLVCLLFRYFAIAMLHFTTFCSLNLFQTTNAIALPSLLN